MNSTTAFFEIAAVGLLGAELLPLPRNPQISAIFGSSGKIHSIEAKLVCKPLFGELSPARSSAYGRREFLWKSLGFCTFGFLPVWESASAFPA